MKILFVEDFQDVAQVLREVMDMECPDPERILVHAATYADAIKELQKARFDLIVADFEFIGELERKGKQGPLAGGVDLYRYVLQTCPETPFYYASGVEKYDIIEALQNAGLEFPRARILPKSYDILCTIIKDYKANSRIEPSRPLLHAKQGYSPSRDA